MRLAVLLVCCGCRQILGFEDPVDPSQVDANLDDANLQDASPIIADAGLCTSISVECVSPDILRTCSVAGAIASDTACVWGCVPTGSAHCGTLIPRAGATEGDVTTTSPNLTDVTLLGGLIVDGDTGRIGTTANPTSVRGMGTGIINGIDFRQDIKASVFRFKRLVVGTGGIVLAGTSAITLVSNEQLDVNGVINAQGTCMNLGTNAGMTAGPGGFQGAPQRSDAMGSGAGLRGLNNPEGGGGGGSGGLGGAGGGALNGGPSFDPQLATLVGGGGGGGGGGSAGDTDVGGGGGGALALISNTRIAIGSSGGINASGCGGYSANGGGSSGSGGGAGGAILLEAPTIQLAGTLAVNGGGGGGGGNANAPKGENGKLGRIAALGATSADGNAGNGATGVTINGGAGQQAVRSGGGGGAIGRIRFDTKRDMGLILDGSFVASPNLSDASTTCTRGAANVR